MLGLKRLGHTSICLAHSGIYVTARMTRLNVCLLQIRGQSMPMHDFAGTLQARVSLCGKPDTTDLAPWLVWM